MGIETYLLTSALKGILNQRLVRRLCPVCRQPGEQGFVAVGCDQCLGTGYQARILLAELVTLDDALRQAILKRADTMTLERCVADSGRLSIWTAAENALMQGWTTAAEVTRVLGPRH